MKDKISLLKGKSSYLNIVVVLVLTLLVAGYFVYNKKNKSEEPVVNPADQARSELLSKSKFSILEAAPLELAEDKALPKEVSSFLDLNAPNSLYQVQQSKDASGKNIYKISLVAPKDLVSFNAQVLALLKNSKLWGEVTNQNTDLASLIETESTKYRVRITSSTISSTSFTNVLIEVQSK